MARDVAYAVSKGALQQATLTLADELAGRGITVNIVNPGPTETGWGLADEDPAHTMPFGHWGTRTTRRGSSPGFAATTHTGSPVRRLIPKAASVVGADVSGTAPTPRPAWQRRTRQHG
jgi:NAD(P)-dependent dehydrogenase (short-subunit alcohol dehydrogenase family)